MARQTKVVKVPVRVLEDDGNLRKIKYRALDRTMQEARYLGNLALRYAVAFNLEEIPDEIDENGKSVSHDTRIYRILAKKRRFLDSGNMATLERNFAMKMFRNTTKDAWKGLKSLPTYRSLFVPIRKQGTRIVEVDEDGKIQFDIHPNGFGPRWLSDELIRETGWESDIPDLDRDQRRLALRSRFSYKDQGALSIVKRILSGKYSLSDSQIQRNRKNDLFVIMTYSFTPEKPELDPAVVCGVDLGVKIPAVCAINTGPQRAYLGDGGDVWAARSKFRAERRRKQRREGLRTKTRNWERSVKEDNWIHTYYHTITREVIKFCERYGCGTIHLEDLTRLRSEDVESEYRRIMWIPAKFGELLSYKAGEKGIEIVKVNPRNTSRRCSACGYIDKANRPDQETFICQKCGDPKRPVKADYNAAKNIALAEGDIIEHGYLIEDEEQASPS